MFLLPYFVKLAKYFVGKTCVATMRSFLGNETKWLRYAAVALCCFSDAAVGNPVGGQVSSGTGSITTSGSTTTIVQSSPGAVVSWTGFSIAAGETVKFVQPSAASTVLLRVIGSDPSQITGTLQSNGRVFIVNPAGISFGSATRTDVGSLVASTLSISNENFLSNRLQLSGVAGQGAISVAGAITTASGGSVFLVSPDINNTGTISAIQGDIVLAAGTSVDLTTPASPVVSVAAGAPLSNVNSGQLSAQTGTIGIYGGSINLNGALSAGGGITADSTGTITVGSAGMSTVGTVILNAAGTVTLANAGSLTNTGSVTLTGAGTGANAGPVTLTGTGTGALTNVGAVTLTGASTLGNAGPVTLPAGALTVAGLVIAATGGTSTVTVSPVSPITGIILSSNTINLATGWNLVGNSIFASLAVATTLGDATKIGTVWKWIPATSKWAFYAPSLTGEALTNYAADKGYDVLATINSGEGFWVNAKTPFSFALPPGLLLPASTFKTTLASGWNLVSIGENKTPSQFNTALSQTQPAIGAIPTNFTTLWAWDNTLSNWYFYAPSVEAQGGAALTDYITAKGYLNFTGNKTLGSGMGFWVYRP